MIREMIDEGYTRDEIARRLVVDGIALDEEEAWMQVTVVLDNPHGDIVMERPDPVEFAHRIDEMEE